MRTGTSLVLSLLAAFALVACGDNGTSDDSNGSGNGASPESITREDLPVLVLTQAELGPLAEGLVIDAGSGYEDNADAAERSFNPDATEESVAASGRLDGYALAFELENFFAAFEATEGYVFAESLVERYDTAGNASAAIAAYIEDYLAADGEVIDLLAVRDVEEWDVAGLGDEVAGVRLRADFPGESATFYVTIAYFRAGPIVGSVTVLAAGDEDARGDVEEALQALEARLNRFLDGDLADATPVPLPADDGDDDTGNGRPGDGPAPGVVDVSPAALTLDDLPAGFAITDEEYDPSDPDFSRTFEAASGFTATLGSSEVMQLENNVILFGSTFEASAFIGIITSLLSGEDGAAFFGSFLEEEGLDSDITLESVEIPVGDEGDAIQGTIDAGFIMMDMIFALGRSGEGVSAFIIIGLAGELNIDDFVPLLQTTLDRLDGLPRER